MSTRDRIAVEVLDAILVRDPQPDDVLVVKAPPRWSRAEVIQVRNELAVYLGCKVVVIAGVDIAMRTTPETIGGES